MTEDQELRVIALERARRHAGSLPVDRTMREVVRMADAAAKWLIDGQLPSEEADK